MVRVHGFGISGTYLMPTARLLTDRALNVVPDLPGYGRSQKPPRPLDIPHLADAVIKVLDALEIEQAVFVGDSMGCAIRHLVIDGVPGRRVDAACRGSRPRALRADGNASTRSRRRCPATWPSC